MTITDIRELFATEVLAAAENERATLGNSQSSTTKDGEGAGGLSVPEAHLSRKPPTRRKAATRKGDAQAEGSLKRGKTIAIKLLEFLAESVHQTFIEVSLRHHLAYCSDTSNHHHITMISPSLHRVQRDLTLNTCSPNAIYQCHRHRVHMRPRFVHAARHQSVFTAIYADLQH